MDAYKKVVFQGFSINVSTTVQNHAGFTENFNVNSFANLVPIWRWSVTLGTGDVLVLPAIWTTNGFAKGNYTLSAHAEPVPGETDVASNNVTGGRVVVSMIGDLTGGARAWNKK